MFYVKWTSAANPGLLTAQANTLLPACQINPVSVSSPFMFVVKEKEHQVVANL